MKVPNINEIVRQVKATVQSMPLKKEASFTPVTAIAKDLQSLATRLKTAQLYSVTNDDVITLGRQLLGGQDGS